MPRNSNHHARDALFGGVLTLVAGPALATEPFGVWRTEADRKGQVADVMAEPCDGYVCGTIIRVYDDQGNPVAAPTIGARVFWNMSPEGGEYVGRAYVPAYRREYQGRLAVNGDEMTVKGCLGPICQSQVWTRLQ